MSASNPSRGASSSSPTAPADVNLEEVLVAELWQRARVAGAMAFAVLAITWVALAPFLVHDRTLCVAYGVAAGGMVVRALGSFAASGLLRGAPLRARYAAFFAVSVITGGALGVVSMRALDLEAGVLAVWSLVVGGVLGGATSSMGARPEIFVVYAVSALGPVIARAPFVWPRLGGAMSIAMVIWLMFGTSQARHYRRTRRETILLTTQLGTSLRERDQKNAELEAAQRAMAAKNAELQSKNQELVDLSHRADRIFSALADALPGTTLAGKYRLEDRIGAGGFAVVFRATHLGLNRKVAIKIFRPQAGNDSAAALERFRIEGMSSSAVHHPNIVEVFDAGTSDDGISYIVMELLEGRSLMDELTERKTIEPARAAEVLGQVCRALASAHHGGVIHRDVKPENVFLHRAPEGEIVKLLDFGIAKVRDARGADPNLTATGVFLGTPLYMAPERFTGDACEAAADVYSVGVILYYALSGRYPFPGTLTEIIVGAMNGATEPLHGIAPDAPEELCALAAEMLAPDPSRRPTADEVATRLARIADGRHAASGARRLAG